MTSQKLTQAQLKKQLGSYSPEDLIAEISELYRRFPEVKNYYQLKLSSQSESEIVNEYKAKIKKEFFPARGMGRGRLSVAKKPISEYKKVCFNPTSLVDLMIYYVEQGVSFTNEYGDIGAAFYDGMESMFDQALKIVQENDLHDIFFPRCRAILKDTRGIGWGFHEGLYAIFVETYNHPES
ncbi:MAG: hypothetical protein RLZZ568_732 [Cyanobacteriota bacterium]